jgi:hypothetical protein
MSIKKFTIYGERCSGTTFLENAIKENFDLEITWAYGWKHFFGFSNYENSDDVLFIGINRKFYDYANSLFKSQYHLPENMKNENNFLTNEFYSLNNDGTLIEQDLNIHTKQKYKNIYEMRKIKDDYLINLMQKNVKNYIFIKYEDLLSKYEEILDIIKNKFNLVKKHNIYVHINTYKGNKEIEFKQNKNEYLDKKKFKKLLKNI